MDYVDEEEGALMVRQIAIVPSLKICASNCLNWDIYQKCKIFLKGRLCASWRPIDLGDPVDFYEDPFAVKPFEGEPDGEVGADGAEVEEIEVDGE